jgi:hypothetical protein
MVLLIFSSSFLRTSSSSPHLSSGLSHLLLIFTEGEVHKAAVEVEEVLGLATLCHTR